MSIENYKERRRSGTDSGEGVTFPIFKQSPSRLGSAVVKTIEYWITCAVVVCVLSGCCCGNGCCRNGSCRADSEQTGQISQKTVTPAEYRVDQAD
jgi:hypothetical protein